MKYAAVSVAAVTAVALIGGTGVFSASASPGKSQATSESSASSARHGDHGRIAASITFHETKRPAGLPSTYVAPKGSKLTFYDYTAIDGVTDQATLFQPKRKSRSKTTLIIQVHGSGASYLEDPIIFLAPNLAEKGYATLNINDRQHDGAVNTDNLYGTRNDVQAAVYVARALGYRSIVLEGHSLGTLNVLTYAATAWSTDIKGVMLLSPFANLPFKSRYVLINNDKVYKELYNEAIAAVKAGHFSEILPTEMPYLQGRSTPVSAQQFLTYRWEYESAAVSTKLIRQVIYPVLIVRDQSDQIILPYEPNQLEVAATDYGSLVPSARNVLIPDTSSENGHGFKNTQAQLTSTVLSWLASQHL